MSEKTTIGNLGIEPSVTEGIAQMSRDMKGHVVELKKLNVYAARIGNAIKGMIAAYVGYEAFNRVIVASLNRYAEHEKSLLRLEAILASHNIRGREVNRIYYEMAEKVKNNTRYTIDQALAAEQTLIALGVGPLMMQEALEASVQLSARTGSLESAAQIVGQTLAGNTRAIGKLISSLRGAKDLDAKTIFGAIEKTYGDTAKAEMGGYIGQAIKLRKEYEAFTIRIVRVFAPTITAFLKKVNKTGPGGILTILTNPIGIFQSIAMQEIIQAYANTQWTWSIGRQKRSNVLEEADKQFVKTDIDGIKKSAKSNVESIRDLWIKAQAEEYAAAEELNTKWFEDQRKAAIEANEAEMKANSEAWQENYNAMIESWKQKDAQYKILDNLEKVIMATEMRQINASLDAIRSLNPQSAGASMAVSGLETIVNADIEKADTYKLFLEQAQKQYEQTARDWMAGTKSIYDLESARNDVLMTQFMDDKRAMFTIVKGNLMVFQGIATMLYELKQDTTWFYIVQAIEVQIAELSKIGAMWEAYQIGDKVGGYWAPYLKWVFMAIAAAIGDMHIAMILSKTPTSTTAGKSPIKSIDNSNELIEAATEQKPVWNPTINWHVYNEQRSTMDFSRELLPYVVEAREDMVH